jgi:hypothetical protein
MYYSQRPSYSTEISIDKWTLDYVGYTSKWINKFEPKCNNMGK